MEQHALKKCGAEFIGTFALTFIGPGAIICNQASNGAVGLLGIALAHGLTVVAMIQAIGHISGCHINPAVTCAAMATRRISPVLGVMYMVAQCAGAVVAAVMLREAFDPSVWQKVHLGATGLGSGFTPMAGFKLEAILTFFLVFVIFGSAMDSRGNKLGGLAIGLTVVVDILMGGPLCGASLNPARSFGPAIVSGFMDYHWIYWAGPILGGVVAGLVYDKFIGDVP